MIGEWMNYCSRCGDEGHPDHECPSYPVVRVPHVDAARCSHQQRDMPEEILPAPNVLIRSVCLCVCRSLSLPLSLSLSLSRRIASGSRRHRRRRRPTLKRERLGDPSLVIEEAEPSLTRVRTHDGLRLRRPRGESRSSSTSGYDQDGAVIVPVSFWPVVLLVVPPLVFSLCFSVLSHVPC